MIVFQNKYPLNSTVLSQYTKIQYQGHPQIYFLENRFIVFLDRIEHRPSKTFYEIEKYYFYRDYYRLTLRKLAICLIISKCKFLTLKPI